MPYYHVDNYLSKARSIDGDLEWLVMNHLCEPVDNDEYQVIAVPLPIR